MSAARGAKRDPRAAKHAKDVEGTNDAKGAEAAEPAGLPQRPSRIAHALEGAAGGAIAGGAAGALGGPPGAIAGALVGAVVGAAAETALQRDEDDEQAKTEQLDEAIGVAGGDLGAPGLRHPPARSGAYSAASAGVSQGAAAPAEGPMPSSGEDEG